jgi:hypothetical protein
MKAEFLSQLFTNTPLTVAGLLIFFIAFLVLFHRAYLRKEAKAEYEILAQLPLKEDEVAL